MFPWKQFKNKPIDLTQIIKQKTESEEQLIDTSSSPLSPRTEMTMSKLRKLHLGFIEDWWFEIATLMDESRENYDRIDGNELEYVKRLIQSGDIRVELDWLRAKVLIVRYFKATRRLQLQQVSSIEES